MKSVGTTHPQINILYEFINKGYEVIFQTFVVLRKYMKLRPHEHVKFKKSSKIGPHEFYSD